MYHFIISFFFFYQTKQGGYLNPPELLGHMQIFFLPSRQSSEGRVRGRLMFIITPVSMYFPNQLIKHVETFTQCTINGKH